MRTRVLKSLVVLLLLALAPAGATVASADGDRKPTKVLHGLETGFAFFFNCAVYTDVLEGDDVAPAEDYDAWQARCGDTFEELAEVANPGDGFITSEELYADETVDGRLLGHNLIECTLQLPPLDSCHGTIHFTDGGDVTWQGVVDYTEGDPFAHPDVPFITAAVTGGTGKYFGARGELRAYSLTEPRQGPDTDGEPAVNRLELYLER